MRTHQQFTLGGVIRRTTLCLLGAAAPLAHASTFTTLAIPTFNSDMRTFSGGAVYAPLYPSTQTWNGTPFQFAEDGSGNTVFARGVLDIPVGVFGVTQAFTIINSGFGAAGANNGSVEFFGTSSYYKVDLIQGINIRDHFDNVFNNSIDGINALPALVSAGPQNARLDEQIYTLPASFANDTLTTIRFTGLDLGNAGIPFIAAATVSIAAVVPEPGTYALMLAGLAGVGLVVRRRSAG